LRGHGGVSRKEPRHPRGGVGEKKGEAAWVRRRKKRAPMGGKHVICVSVVGKKVTRGGTLKTNFQKKGGKNEVRSLKVVARKYNLKKRRAGTHGC